MNKTAADIREDDVRLTKAFNGLLEKMRLRQWCLEQAIKGYQPPLDGSHGNLVELANNIYDFVRGDADTTRD